jgi:hypothetical protein
LSVNDKKSSLNAQHDCLCDRDASVSFKTGHVTSGHAWPRRSAPLQDAHEGVSRGKPLFAAAKFMGVDDSAIGVVMTIGGEADGTLTRIQGAG